MRFEAVPVLALLLVLAAAPPCRAADTPAPSAGSYILPTGQLRRGDLVPRFQAVDIYGVEVDLEKLLRAGKHPLLAFWSMYCKSCIDKFDAMTTIQSRYASQDLVVISINTDGEYRRGPQMVRDFIADYERRRGVRINFPILYDERNWVAQAMNVEVLPTIVTVDEVGRVGNFYQSFGKTTKKDVPAGQAVIAGLEELVRQQLHLSATWETSVAVDVSTTGFGAEPPGRGGLLVGAPIPPIRGRGIMGRDIDLRGMLAQRSKILLVFWSMYCKSCVEKFRALVAIRERYGPEGVKIISVNTDGEYGHGADTVRRFITEFEEQNKLKFNFPVLYDEKNPLPQALQIEFLPTIVSVDPDGRVLNIYQKFDESSDETIYAGIEGVVQEMLERFAARAPAPLPGVE
ncbi:MAG: redoxin domain-containing protein [Candidatus Methylomirabilia bacterium]